MLSFWPSLSLLVFFLVILLECRAIAGRVTLPLGGFLMVFCYGAIGAPLLALLLQQILTPSDPSAESMRLMAWLIAPPIEELAKALPVIALAFLTREARRLSIADLALIGFASGAGFGFVEANLNAMVNGSLPGLTHLAALGLQSGNGVVFFAGHAVTTALVGLAAGVGLRFLPLKILYAWAPAAFVILWASFDHGIYNWKLLNADSTGALPNAHFVTELLHAATLKGRLATWLLALGLIAAQFFEAYLCSKAVGARRDLLLAREWRPWVINEWLVALLRAPLGRAAFGQTLAYFRLRRAFYLASFEARRDPGDPTWTRHARALEERLKRERSILFDPPPGTWLLPLPVLKTYAAEWTWRMRWVLLFAVLFVFLFLLGPRSLPEWLRQALYGETFTIAMVAAGLAFAVWRIVLFVRQPRPDPLAAEGAACAAYYTRALLLGCSFVCGLFPAAALLLGWKAFAPGAAFLSGYLPGWIAQGGNLQTLLGLGAIGSAVSPEPRPAGEAYRHEIAAADERIRLLALDIEDTTGAAETASPGSGRPLQLEAFLDAMAKLDAERDAQARRQLVLDEFERHAGEATVTDPAPAAQAVKDEFDRLTSELLDAAAKELDAIASLEQAYGRAWAEIMQDLDAHDVLRRRLSVPLRAAWQAKDDIGWALRVVKATDEGLLPMQLTLLSELQAVATSAPSTRADMVAAGIERIREAAAQYGEEDPFTFAGTQQAEEDEAALLAEFASLAPEAETAKAFGLRTPPPAESPAARARDDVKAEPPQPAPSPVQEALEQLIESSKSDERYLETIRHLERSAEALRQPLAPVEAKPQPTAPLADTLAELSGRAQRGDDLENLIDAIKRDSGYLDFTKDAQASLSGDSSVPAPELAAAAPTVEPGQTADDALALELEAPIEVHEPAADAAPLEPAEKSEPEETFASPAPPAELAAQTTDDVREEPAPDTSIVDKPVLVATAAEPIVERAQPDETVPAPTPEPSVASHPDTPELDLSLTLGAEAPTTAGEAAPLEAAERSEPDETFSEPVHAPAADTAAVVQTANEERETAVLVETPAQSVVQLAEPDDAESAPVPESAVGDASVQAHATAEPFMLVAQDERVAEAEAAEATTTPVTHEESEQLALPLSPAQPEAPRADEKRAETPEPLRSEAFTLRPDTSGRIAVETPAAVESPGPAIEPFRPREPDDSVSKAEIRSSLFTRLFQSIRRQSAESTAKHARREEPKPVDSTPAQPVVTPGIADQPALQPQTPPSEITTPKATWLADFAEAKPEAVAAPTDDTPLEPIEWPALNRVADDSARAASADLTAFETQAVDDAADARETVPEAATPVVDPGSLETALADEIVVASAPDETTGATVTAVTVESLEFEAPAKDAADSSIAEQPAVVEPAIAVADEPVQPQSVTPVAAEATDAEVEKPQRTDEFASKAERLSYLLTKLEQAIQANSAASSAPAEAPSPTTDTTSSRPQDIAAKSVAETQASETTAAVEPTIAVTQRPIEVESSVAQPIAEAQPAKNEPSPVAPEHRAAIETQLKPDRLSFFFDKLFETAKRAPVEQPAEPQHAGPEPVPAAELVPPEEAAPAYPAESEVLDLRGPVPLPDPPDDDEPSIAVAPLPPQDSKTEAPVQAAAAPVEFPVAREKLQPAPSDTTPIERAEPAPSQSEPKPLATAQDVTRHAAPTQPSDQPVAPTPRPRPAEPATHFGSRSKPPRPKSPVRAGDVRPMASTPERVSQAPEPERPAASASVVSAEAETPASTPKRDWKLARGEASKPIDTPTADTAKKPDIRIKTGSGALATTDEAPTNSPAATGHTPGKYYGPRLSKADDEPGANTPAQQRALSLADALTDYYAKSGEPQPPMHTTDRATLQRIIANGKLEAPRRRGAAWSISGMARRGEVAIRLKPGAEQFIEFVPSNEIFGQVAHYYPRGVGKGSFVTHIPAGHLEYFDATVHQWVPLLRGRE